MIRTLSSTLLALALLAGPASAAEVRVTLTGKDAQTIRADIQKAAETACKEAYRDASIDEAFSDMKSCVSEAAAEAVAKVPASMLSASSAPIDVLASNDSSAKAQ